MKKISPILFLFLLLIIFNNDAIAQTTINTGNPTDSLFKTFVSQYQIWQNKFIQYGKYVFFSLAVIDMVLTFGQMAVRGEIEFSGVVATLIQKVLIYGFFLMLFLNIHWLASIPNSGIDIGEQLSGMTISPDFVFVSAVRAIDTILDKMGFWKGVGLNFALVIAGCAAFFSILWMGLRLFICWVKVCFLLAFAPFSFALGALGYTRNMAWNPFISLLKTTLEFVLIILIISLVLISIQNFTKSVDSSITQVFTFLGIVFCCMSLVEMSPGIVDSLFSGSIAGNSMAGVGAARTAGAMIGTAAAAALGGAIGGAAGAKNIAGSVKEAASLAKEQLGEGAGKGEFFKQTLSNLSAYKKDANLNKATGEAPKHGSTYAQMSKSMREDREGMQANKLAAEQQQNSNDDQSSRYISPLNQNNDSQFSSNENEDTNQNKES